VVSVNDSGALVYDLSLSIGVARYEASAPCSLDELLRKADRAMYERKQNRKRSAPGASVPASRSTI
jgi:GGDEF domain-containing protein